MLKLNVQPSWCNSTMNLVNKVEDCLLVKVSQRNAGKDELRLSHFPAPDSGKHLFCSTRNELHSAVQPSRSEAVLGDLREHCINLASNDGRVRASSGQALSQGAGASS